VASNEYFATQPVVKAWVFGSFSRGNQIVHTPCGQSCCHRPVIVHSLRGKSQEMLDRTEGAKFTMAILAHIQPTYQNQPFPQEQGQNEPSVSAITLSEFFQ